MVTDSTSSELMSFAPLPKSDSFAMSVALSLVVPFKELSMGTPSTMYKGELLFNEEIPRTNTF